jgi:hypothetical protein
LNVAHHVRHFIGVSTEIVSGLGTISSAAMLSADVDLGTDTCPCIPIDQNRHNASCGLLRESGQCLSTENGSHGCRAYFPESEAAFCFVDPRNCWRPHYPSLYLGPDGSNETTTFYHSYETCGYLDVDFSPRNSPRGYASASLRSRRIRVRSPAPPCALCCCAILALPLPSRILLTLC